MAGFAALYRERHGKVTDTAELSIENPDHLEMFRGFFLDVEDGGVAIVAVQPFYEGLVGKDRGRNSRPLGLKRQILLEIHAFGWFDRQEVLGTDLPHPFGLGPIDTITEICSGKLRCKSGEFLCAIISVPIMAFVTVRLVVAENRLAVMTTGGAAMKTRLIRPFRDLCGVHLHVEFELKMANPACMFLPVYPV